MQLKQSDQKLEELQRQYKHLQLENQECQDRFRTLVEHSPIGICIIQKHKIVYRNPALEELLGPLPQKIRNNILKALDYVHPEDLDKVRQAYEQLASGEVDTSSADFGYRKIAPKKNDPGIVFMSCKAVPIFYQGEEAILLNVMNISKLKKAEQLLQIRQKMSALGHVAAGIAHEIRNPLTGINSYLYTLQDLCEGEIIQGEQIELLKKITKQFQHASDKIEMVIKRVLDFSRPNPPVMALVGLNQCINNALDLAAAMLRRDSIKLEKDLEKNLTQCYADVHLIEQAVLNLINNAVQAMKKIKKPKRLQIKSFSKDDNLYISVADSGPGIPPNLKNQIFDPFFTTNADGTGIGLSITQRIISDHHGSITIQDNQYGGATFTIELPLEKRIRAR